MLSREQFHSVDRSTVRTIPVPASISREELMIVPTVNLPAQAPASDFPLRLFFYAIVIHFLGFDHLRFFRKLCDRKDDPLTDFSVYSRDQSRALMPRLIRGFSFFLPAPRFKPIRAFGHCFIFKLNRFRREIPRRRPEHGLREFPRSKPAGFPFRFKLLNLFFPPLFYKMPILPLFPFGTRICFLIHKNSFRVVVMDSFGESETVIRRDK